MEGSVYYAELEKQGWDRLWQEISVNKLNTFPLLQLQLGVLCPWEEGSPLASFCIQWSAEHL